MFLKHKHKEIFVGVLIAILLSFQEFVVGDMNIRLVLCLIDIYFYRNTCMKVNETTIQQDQMTQTIKIIGHRFAVIRIEQLSSCTKIINEVKRSEV